MSPYRLLSKPQGYGYDIGMLILDEVEHHVPGDATHASTYPYPVLFLPVAGATVERMLRGDPALLPAVIDAARELEHMGVAAISSNCGFMLQFQEAVAEAVQVPVMLSSLMQLDLITQALGGRPFGIVTASLTNYRRLEQVFPGLRRARAQVVGLDGTLFLEQVRTPDFDPGQLQAWLLASARDLIQTHGIGALLLECSLLTPYTKALQVGLGIPVFDFVTMIDYLHAALRPRASRPLP